MPRLSYRVKNWKSYNQALINRGSLTIWVDEQTVEDWLTDTRTGKRGRPYTYSVTAIETGLTLRTLWQLPLRMAQGLLRSIFELMGIDLPVPNYTTLCRRGANLSIDLKVRPSQAPRHLVIDSTGLKVFGEGEWHMRTHGKSKRRTWRKLHLSVDAKTHEIVASQLTMSNVHDSTQVQRLLPEDQVEAVYGDKAYDNQNAYEPIVTKGAKAVIPPRSGAALMKPKTWGIVARNTNVAERWFLGNKLWKVGRGYHRRSLAETAMYRQKQILGNRLRSKNILQQNTEARIRASILNQMTQLGMPQSYRVP